MFSDDGFTLQVSIAIMLMRFAFIILMNIFLGINYVYRFNEMTNMIW